MTCDHSSKSVSGQRLSLAQPDSRSAIGRQPGQSGFVVVAFSSSFRFFFSFFSRFPHTILVRLPLSVDLCPAPVRTCAGRGLVGVRHWQRGVANDVHQIGDFLFFASRFFVAALLPPPSAADVVAFVHFGHRVYRVFFLPGLPGI